MLVKDIKQRRGSKKEHRFEMAGNLANHEISFVVKASTELTEARTIDKNNLRSGEVELSYNSSTGRTRVSIYLQKEDTYQLKPGNYYYDLDDLTVSNTLAEGLFILSADVQTPFDNVEFIPQNCPRAIIVVPDEFEDNMLVYKITEGGKSRFTGVSIGNAKSLLGITALENCKVDKEAGKGLSDINFTPTLKNNYDSAFAEKHNHTNKTNLDLINQGLGTTCNPQFNQLGIGRSVFGAWSLSLQGGISTRSGTYIDWEGGNARIRETGYNLEFSSFDGSSLSVSFRTGAAANTSIKPLITNGQIHKTVSVSSNITLTASDHIALVTTSTSDKTVTLPVTGIPDGTVYIVKKIDSGSGKVIIQGAGGTIDGQAAIELTNQYNTVHFIKNGFNYYILNRYN